MNTTAPIVALVISALVTACAGAPDAPEQQQVPAAAAVAQGDAPRAGYSREQDVWIARDLVWSGESRIELSCDDGYELARGGCVSGSAHFTRSSAKGAAWICTTDTPPPATIGVCIECTPAN